MIALLLVSAPFLSVGENPLTRETIVYDPQRMPHLQIAYDAFSKELPALATEDLLKKVSTYIRETVFDMSHCNESSVRALVSLRRRLSLDFFVASKIGICRHFALVTQYFIERLIDDGKLQGTCQFVRAVVPQHGKHAWILLQEGAHLWHLDPYWGFFGDLNTTKDRSWLMPLYGYEGGKLKTLISDLGNVLLFFSHERMCQQLAAVSGLPLTTIKKMLFEQKLGEQLEYGTLSSAGLHNQICATSGNSIDFNKMLLAAADIFQVNEEMIPFLETLKSQGKRLILLSNTCEAHFTYARAHFPFLNLFDAYILSYELGARKPEEKIFRAALDAAGCAPEECLYIDDIAEYVEAATKLNIPSHTFKNLRELINAQKQKEKSPSKIST